MGSTPTSLYVKMITFFLYSLYIGLWVLLFFPKAPFLFSKMKIARRYWYTGSRIEDQKPRSCARSCTGSKIRNMHRIARAIENRDLLARFFLITQPIFERSLAGRASAARERVLILSPFCNFCNQIVTICNHFVISYIVTIL